MTGLIAALSSKLTAAVGFASLISPTTASALPASGGRPSYPTWGEAPAGAHDWDCRALPVRLPAVIARGASGDQRTLRDPRSCTLDTSGYCLDALDDANRGTVPLQRSARPLDRVVDGVLAATRAERISPVGSRRAS